MEQLAGRHSAAVQSPRSPWFVIGDHNNHWRLAYVAALTLQRSIWVPMRSTSPDPILIPRVISY